MSQINFPNSPADGEEFLAPNGTTYQYDSSTGQWKILAGPGVQGPAGNTGPTGSIIMWGTSTLPEGYIECNGQSTASFPALAALYGSNVPDLRGEFVRGWDNGKGTDTGRALLSTQDDEFESHSHFYGANTVGTGGSGRQVPYSITPNGNWRTGTTSTGGTETRPRNIALMYIIKT